MEKREQIMRQKSLLHRLSQLPGKMISSQDYQNLAEFVLYDLCHPECFSFEKVAFLIDNPDFNCIKGVAGLVQHDRLAPEENIWQKPKDFSQHMQARDFNKKVRACEGRSVTACGNDCDSAIREIAVQLGMANPSIQVFNLKHNNNGVLLFECSQPDFEDIQEHVTAGASLLAFCPIF